MKPNSIKILIRETNVNYYAWSMIADGFLLRPEVKKYLGTDVTAGAQEIVNGAGQYGFDYTNWCDLGKRLIERLQQGTFSVEQLAREHIAAGTKIMALCKFIEQQDLKNATNAQISKWLQGLWKPFLEINALGFMPVVSDFEHNYLTNRLVTILRVHDVAENDIQRILSDLITPTIESIFWLEQKELLTLATEVKDTSLLKNSKELKRHAERYVWLNYGYQGPEWKEPHFLSRLKRILEAKQSVASQLEEHSEHRKKRELRQKAILSKLKLDRKEKYLFTTAKQFVYLKGYRVEVRHYFHYVSDLIFAELSRRFNLHSKFFQFATREETIRVLEGKAVNKRAIVERIAHTIEITDHKKRTFYSPRAGKKVLEKILQKEEVATSDDLTGQIAYAGRARGRAKIVHSIDDLEKVVHGDILVAITTNPDFLPAMYKAIAFVTDVGGITSHAAIVAREMKKPCVIGTKFATKILRDGDMVEVDAIKGIVGKIK